MRSPITVCAGPDHRVPVRNGGDLENAARIAGHESTRTTQLYIRLHEKLSLDEIERIRYLRHNK